MTEREVELKIPVEVPTEVRAYFVPVPKEYVEDAFKKDEFIVLIGPQHAGSGHMRIILRLKGDYIVDVIPDPGYVHRAVEKLAETRLFIQNIPLVERPAIMDSGNLSLGYVRAIEKVLDIEPSPRAKYLRTIVAELCRIGTHLYDTAIWSIFLNHSTGYMWCFGLREIICEALSRLTGARVTLSYIIPGGVRHDVDEGVLRYIHEVTNVIEKKLPGFERIFVKNPAVIARLKEVGVLTKQEAIKYGVVGPNLRASGVEYDVRKIEPYEAYSEIEWDIPVCDDGDAYARLLVRIEEIRQSIRIIRQAIRNIPSGPILSEKLLARLPPAEREKAAKTIKSNVYRLYAMLIPPSTEATILTEAARGLLLYTLVTDGASNVPYRLRMVTPSWLNLRGFMEALKGYRLADLPAIYGSFGYFPPEADR